MKAKTSEKLQAIELRKTGKSIGDIAKKLNVSKGSVSCWVSDVDVSKFKEELEKKNPASKKFEGIRSRKCYDKRSQVAKENRMIYQEDGRKASSSLDLHLAGCMLYWGEGSKCRNTAKITNCDPELMKLFVKFLIECFNVDRNDIIVNCRTRYDAVKSIDEIEKYWLDQLNLPKECLRKTSIETRIPKKKKIKYEYGICSVSVNKTKIVQHIFGAIKEYAGIKDVNLWLN